MSRKLKKEVQEIWNKISVPNILNDVFVMNEFHKRKLKVKNIDKVTLTFRATGTVFVSDNFSTESHSCEIAIMKMLIQKNITENEDNYYTRKK